MAGRYAQNGKNKLRESVYYYPEDDVLYVSGTGKALNFTEVTPGIRIATNKNGKVTGIEIRNASEIPGCTVA